MKHYYMIAFLTVLILLKCESVNSQTDTSFGLQDSVNTNIENDSLTAVDSVKYYFLSVKTNIENAEVYSDTVLIGRTPLDTFKIKEGEHKLKVVNPISLKEWQNYIVNRDVEIKSDTLINIDFSYFYLIETDPFNAKVYNNDSLLGETPLRFFTKNKLTGFLNFNKKNYKDKVFNLDDYNFATGLNLELFPKGTESVNDIVYKDRSTQFNTKRHMLPIIGTAGLALASGVFAINYKSTANSEYNKYLVSGNTNFLDEANTNDTYFTVAIILMQVGLAGLIYFLFFD